jgi:hypothetical protein
MNRGRLTRCSSIGGSLKVYAQQLKIQPVLKPPHPQKLQ